jgi:hypothetical protein
MSGSKSLIVNSNGLFNIKPTALLSANSVSKTIVLLNELSFNIEGSAISKFPLFGLIISLFIETNIHILSQKKNSLKNKRVLYNLKCCLSLQLRLNLHLL